MIRWKEWKRIKTKHRNLKKLGINLNKAWESANTRLGYWRIAKINEEKQLAKNDD